MSEAAREIYLDNGASTRPDPQVVEAMMPYFTRAYGNASSLHSQGHLSKTALRESRETIAASLNVKPEEIIFTSGGTEGNNFAIKGIAFANRDKGNHIITTQTEHKCVQSACKWLETQGFDVTWLPVDTEGFVNPQTLESAITDQTILVTIIHANNEVGTIQDLDEVGEICKRRGVIFHTDACQSYTKVPLDLAQTPVDLMTINAHKIHGPKGVGALFIRKGTKITPLFHGAEHEFKLRGGTENIPGIVGFAKAVELASQNDIITMMKLRNKLLDGLLKIEGARLNGPRARLCNNINVSFKAIEGEAIGGMLNNLGVCSSTGSACSEASLEPSHVLTAIGLTHEEANGSLRLTLSKFTTEAEIDAVLEAMPGIVTRLRQISPVKAIMRQG